MTWNGTWTEVDGPNLVTLYLHWTPIFQWSMVRCGLKKGHQKRHCLKVIRLYAQKFADHSRFNSQRVGEGTYIWPFNEQENLHIDNELWETVVPLWICQISCINCVFNALGEMGAELEVPILDPLTIWIQIEAAVLANQNSLSKMQGLHRRRGANLYKIKGFGLCAWQVLARLESFPNVENALTKLLGEDVYWQCGKTVLYIV